MFALLKTSVRQTVSRTKWTRIQKAHILSEMKSKGETLPSPKHILPETDISGVRALLLSNVANGLTKKVQLRLESHGVIAYLAEAQSEAHIKEIAESNAGKYDLIICPFLTKRVPETVWRNKIPCLIVHPGIAGDRGMSSLDWAIDEGCDEWGLTVLQADEEMDAGNIWSTVNFPVDPRTATKTGLYNGPVSDAAVEAVVDSVKRFKLGLTPTPLDYSHPEVRGSLKPKMNIRQRKVDWSESAEDIVRHIRKSDTQPGSRGFLSGLQDEVVMFGAHVQSSNQTPALSALSEPFRPGQVIVQKDGAVLVKAGDGNCVWVTHMKRFPKKSSLKLPAAQVLTPELGPLKSYNGVSSWQEITSHSFSNSRVAVVYFDFYNGAMSTDQCRRLEREIKKVGKDPTVDAVVLLGGKTFFSTGIHLNVIEAAEDPVQESWENINAINDVIKAVFSIKDKVTISALQGSAGAGGVMMAAASDLMWTREGVVLTPSYKAMNLYGSEYWTYFLPSRVGHEVAHHLTESGNSILAEEAKRLGLVDKTFGRSTSEFLNLLPQQAESVIQSPLLDYIRDKKSVRMTDDWFATLESRRSQELESMRKCFVSDAYANARKAFVYH